MNQISIPKPCHENWENMLPEEQGRHCLSCSKTVIDFSNWEQKQLLNYLQNNREEKVCGRFNLSQLEPEPVSQNVFPVIMNSNISLLKKIAAIVLLCFGVMSGTNTSAQKTTGAPICTKPKSDSHQIMGDTVIALPVKKVDTARDSPQIMGKIAVPPKTIKIKPKSASPKH